MLKTLTIAELINFKTYLRETTLDILIISLYHSFLDKVPMFSDGKDVFR